MAPPHKLSFSLIYNINENIETLEEKKEINLQKFILKKEYIIKNKYFREIKKIHGDFYIFPNEEDINLFVPPIEI